MKHSQSIEYFSNKFTMPLQYLKKKLGMELNFLCAYKYQSFFKFALLFLMEVVRHVQSIQNRKLVIFLQYVKKKVLKLHLCSTLMQKNIQIFYGGPVLLVVTCYFSTYIMVK